MRLRPKTLAVLVVGASALFVIGRGLMISGYEPVTSDRYLWGAFHVHSTMSDGSAPLDAIAAQAKSARVGVVLLSDHGAPHREASLIGDVIDGVRFIGGSEVGMPEGHLIVSDVDALPDHNLPPFPPDAVEDVREWGGFSVLTYPEDPTHRWLYWDEDFVPNAIEIINVTSYFRASSLSDKLAWAVFSMFNRYYYVSGFDSPAYALERWDELLTRGKVWAFYAANAHGGFPLTEERWIDIPSYETAFSYAGLGIDRRFESDPMRAIRDGEFFAIVRGAGEPERFELERRNDGVHVRVDVDGLETRTVLKRGGNIVSESREPSLVHHDASPGVYRAEVYLTGHPLLPDDVPWILSNPIFVDVEPALPERAELDCSEVDAVDLTALHVEKDESSKATLALAPTGELTITYELSLSTTDHVDRWVALAHRQNVDLSRYRGVSLTARGPRPMRYWIEVRAGEVGHYATFKVDESSADEHHSHGAASIRRSVRPTGSRSMRSTPCSSPSIR